MAEGETPDIFVSSQQGESFQKTGRKKVIFSLIALLLLLGVGGGVLFLRRSPGSDVATTNSATVSGDQATGIASVGDTASQTAPLFGDANYQSENFRIGDVSIGGEAQFLLSEDDPAPLDVSAIRGEAFTEKNKPEVKLVVGWRTNKLAKSVISYSKGVGQAKKSIEEEDYSLSHSIIIPGLDQASTYVYEIKSTDRFGNEVTSEAHAVYTGSRTVSLFDLIANAVGDVFGWAVKKN